MPSPSTPGADDRTDTYRTLDAAANRAREGLRVVEDFVRFSLDDPHLAALLKSYRHDLTALLKQFDERSLLAARDTLADVGTQISTPAEEVRTSPLDVAQAALKRVQEAVRTLEEFSKLIDPGLGHEFGQLRYRFYTVEKAVLTTRSQRRLLAGCSLYLLVTSELCRTGIEQVVRGSVGAGARIVQLREKSIPDRELVALARKLREWTRAGGALFIMNDRPDIALLADADGVHVGQDELSVRDARRIVGPERLIGVSTHSIEQARQAVLDGADYLGVGPVFPSTTKQFDALAGLKFVRQVAAEITLPWYAIGGIDADNLDQVLAAGAARIAVSSAICAAADPADAARRLTTALVTPAAEGGNGN